MFGKIKLTEKGCKFMIECVGKNSNIKKMFKTTLQPDMSIYFVSDDNNNHIQRLASDVVYNKLRDEWWKWSSVDLTDDYKQKSRKFLVELGYFRESDIDTHLPKIGGFRMGGQATILTVLEYLLK